MSQNLAVRQAMQAEQLELAMTLLRKQKQTTPERGANKREM
ncbi:MULTISPECIES: hypothetical protein [Acetobacter]|nr:hypothetical protein [Acetobacter lovaniensis]